MTPPSSARLRDTWLLGAREFVQLLGAYVVLVVVGVGVHEVAVDSDGDGWLVRRDDRVADWFASRRGPAADTMSLVGSWLAETVVKVAVTAFVVAVMLYWCRRWFEATVVAGALVLEAAAFVTITTIVGRPRPSVPRLDDSPISSSYPSGHTAAAAAYGALVVVLVWRWRSRLLAASGWALIAAVTAIVGVSRMYRGMHHLSDVIAGALLGLAAVGVVSLIVRGAFVRRSHTENEDAQQRRPLAAREIAHG